MCVCVSAGYLEWGSRVLVLSVDRKGRRLVLCVDMIMVESPESFSPPFCPSGRKAKRICPYNSPPVVRSLPVEIYKKHFGN